MERSTPCQTLAQVLPYLFSVMQRPQVGVVIRLLLLLRKQMLRGVKKFAPGHTGSKWQS